MKYDLKAAKASDKKYIATMNKKISQLSAEERDGRYAFVKDLLKD